MTNLSSNVSVSSDCPAAQAKRCRIIPMRQSIVGKNTPIHRALPHREKRTIGAWCFLDHAGPTTFDHGKGLDVGPHPHIGLQTFTWMIEGSLAHTDSLGNEQLIQPSQVNLMTAGQGISHTEVSPERETRMHAAQLWIALPDDKRTMQPKFEHYPNLPTVQQDGANFTILVGDFLGQTSPVEVYSPLLGVDIFAENDTRTTLTLNPNFEYGLIILEGTAHINDQPLAPENLLVLDIGQQNIHIQMPKDSRVLLIGGEPFQEDIILWWNLVARTHQEIAEARRQWVDLDERAQRFGSIPSYQGASLIAPELPDGFKASQ